MVPSEKGLAELLTSQHVYSKLTSLPLSNSCLFSGVDVCVALNVLFPLKLKPPSHYPGLKQRDILV